MTNLEAAIIYLKRYKFSVIPMNPDKKKGAFIKWKEFQDRLPTEEEVKYWFTLWPEAFVAAVTGKISNLCCIDLDLYKMTEAEKEAALALIPDSQALPTISTPRGGHHYLFSFDEADGLSNCQGILKNVDFQGEGGVTILPPSRNGKGAYEWVKGLTLKETPLFKVPIYIKEKIINNTAYIENKGRCAANPYLPLNTLKTLNLFSTEGTRDQAFFHAANCMIKGGLEPAYCYELLETTLEKANQNSKEKYTKEEIAAKIESALSRSEQRKRNLSDEIREWITLNDLNFSLKDLKSDLKTLNSKDSNIIYVTINSLCKQGVIEKDGKIPGIYRKCDAGVNFVDISEAEELTYLDLKWPVKVEEYVNVSPKSISIIAGDTEAGKSAFLVNFSHLNLDSHKILYFSSEMTASRFRERIGDLPRPLKEWKKLLFTNDKTENFHDAIDPNAINIIDYLELDPGRVFDVAIFLRKIFEKLNTGIAIVALQKKRGEALAYGRDWTMQKSEFYLTLSSVEGENIARIEKAKNWAIKRANPVGLKKKFLLVDGVKFFPSKTRPDWYRGEGDKEEDYV
jgi:hypothetical protein